MKGLLIPTNLKNNRNHTCCYTSFISQHPSNLSNKQYTQTIRSLNYILYTSEKSWTSFRFKQSRQFQLPLIKCNSSMHLPQQEKQKGGNSCIVSVLAATPANSSNIGKSWFIPTNSTGTATCTQINLLVCYDRINFRTRLVGTILFSVYLLAETGSIYDLLTGIFINMFNRQHFL